MNKMFFPLMLTSRQGRVVFGLGCVCFWLVWACSPLGPDICDTSQGYQIARVPAGEGWSLRGRISFLLSASQSFTSCDFFLMCFSAFLQVLTKNVNIAGYFNPKISMTLSRTYMISFLKGKWQNWWQILYIIFSSKGIIAILKEPSKIVMLYWGI